MSSLALHEMDAPWTSSSGALTVTVDPDVYVGPAPGSNRFAAPAGAPNAYAEWDPTAPIDLSGFDELRFWVRAQRAADGSTIGPFYLDISYLDSVAGDEHHWYVPVNESGKWEHRRVGIGKDNRSGASRFRFTCLDQGPVLCNIDELIAVNAEPLLDLESALVAALAKPTVLPGLSAIALDAPATAPSTQLVLVYTPRLGAGNRVVLRGGTVADQMFDVASVTHDPAQNRTTLQLGAGQRVAGNAQPGTATIDVLVPVFVDIAPGSGTLATPALELTSLDVREDLERTATFTQRDSFRAEGRSTVCSVRPAPRAYLVEYQLTVHASDRSQELAIHAEVLRRISTERTLRVNGDELPMLIMPPPAVETRDPGSLDPVYVRIGTTIEVAGRRVLSLARFPRVGVAPASAPQDQEWQPK